MAQQLRVLATLLEHPASGRSQPPVALTSGDPMPSIGLHQPCMRVAYVQVHEHTHAYIHTCTSTDAHIYTHRHTYTDTHAQTHTQIGFFF